MVKSVILADTVISLGSCHARFMHEEEDVPGPEDCILQGNLFMALSRPKCQ